MISEDFIAVLVLMQVLGLATGCAVRGLRTVLRNLMPGDDSAIDGMIKRLPKKTPRVKHPELGKIRTSNGPFAKVAKRMLYKSNKWPYLLTKVIKGKVTNGIFHFPAWVLCFSISVDNKADELAFKVEDESLMARVDSDFGYPSGKYCVKRRQQWSRRCSPRFLNVIGAMMQFSLYEPDSLFATVRWSNMSNYRSFDARIRPHGFFEQDGWIFFSTGYAARVCASCTESMLGQASQRFAYLAFRRANNASIYPALWVANANTARGVKRPRKQTVRTCKRVVVSAEVPNRSNVVADFINNNASADELLDRTNNTVSKVLQKLRVRLEKASQKGLKRRFWPLSSEPYEADPFVFRENNEGKTIAGLSAADQETIHQFLRLRTGRMNYRVVVLKTLVNKAKVYKTLEPPYSGLTSGKKCRAMLKSICPEFRSKKACDTNIKLLMNALLPEHLHSFVPTMANDIGWPFPHSRFTHLTRASNEEDGKFFATKVLEAEGFELDETGYAKRGPIHFSADFYDLTTSGELNFNDL